MVGHLRSISIFTSHVGQFFLRFLFCCSFLRSLISFLFFSFFLSFILSFIQRAYVHHAQHEARHATVPKQVCVAAVSQTLRQERQDRTAFVTTFIRCPPYLWPYIFVTDVRSSYGSFSSGVSRCWVCGSFPPTARTTASRIGRTRAG